MQCRGARLRLKFKRRRDDNENELAGLGLRMSGYLCTYEERSKTVSETSKWLGGPMKHEGMHYVFFFWRRLSVCTIPCVFCYGGLSSSRAKW